MGRLRSTIPAHPSASRSSPPLDSLLDRSTRYRSRAPPTLVFVPRRGRGRPSDHPPINSAFPSPFQSRFEPGWLPFPICIHPRPRGTVLDASKPYPRAANAMALCAGHTSTFLGGTKLSRPTTREHGCAQARQGLVVRCGESRIGKLPVTVPNNVNVDLKGQYLKVKVSEKRRCRARERDEFARVETLQVEGGGRGSDARLDVVDHTPLDKQRSTIANGGSLRRINHALSRTENVGWSKKTCRGRISSRWMSRLADTLLCSCFRVPKARWNGHFRNRLL